MQVLGKTLDQVTDMMVANASNLIITVKPANQRLTLQRPSRKGRVQQASGFPEERPAESQSDSEEDVDEIKDLLHHNLPQQQRNSRGSGDGRR